MERDHKAPRVADEGDRVKVMPASIAIYPHPPSLESEGPIGGREGPLDIVLNPT